MNVRALVVLLAVLGVWALCMVKLVGAPVATVFATLAIAVILAAIVHAIRMLLASAFGEMLIGLAIAAIALTAVLSFLSAHSEPGRDSVDRSSTDGLWDNARR